MQAIEISGSTYTVTGKVVDARTHQPVPGVEVHAFDKDLFTKDDELGHAVTGADGVFTVSFDKSQFSVLFLDQAPDLYFEVIKDGVELHSTKDSHIKNAGPDTPPIVIPVEMPADSTLAAMPDQASAPGPTTWQSMRGGVEAVQAHGDTIFVLESNTSDISAYDGTNWISTGRITVSINNSINAGKNYLLAPEPRGPIYQCRWEADELNNLGWTEIGGSDVVTAQHSSLGTCYLNKQGSVFIFDGPTWYQIATHAKRLYVRETGIFIIDSESNLQVLCHSGPKEFNWILVKKGVSSVDAGRVTYCIGNDAAGTVYELFIGNTTDPNDPQASAYIALCTGAQDLAVSANEVGIADDLYIVNKSGQVQWFERATSSLKDTATMENAVHSIYAQGNYLYAIDDQNNLHRNAVNPQPPAKRSVDWTDCGEDLKRAYVYSAGQSDMQILGMNTDYDIQKWADGTTWDSLGLGNQNSLSQYEGEAIAGGQDGVQTNRWTSGSTDWSVLGHAEKVFYVGIGETGKYYLNESGKVFAWDDANKKWIEIPNYASGENGTKEMLAFLFVTNGGVYMKAGHENLYVYDSPDFPVDKRWTLIAHNVQSVVQGLDLYTMASSGPKRVSKLLLPQSSTTQLPWENIGGGSYTLACGQDTTMSQASGQAQDLLYGHNNDSIHWYNYISKSWEILTRVPGVPMPEYSNLNASFDYLIVYEDNSSKLYYTTFIWHNPPTVEPPTVTPAS